MNITFIAPKLALSTWCFYTEKNCILLNTILEIPSFLTKDVFEQTAAFNYYKDVYILWSHYLVVLLFHFSTCCFQYMC